MSESMIELNVIGLKILRFVKKGYSEKSLNFGYSCMAGDKAIRIYPNNLVEISDLEFIRAEELNGPGAGDHPVAYSERLSWTTHYPQDLSLSEVKASIDFAFMSAGLPSLFYLTNLYLAHFSTIQEQRFASTKAFSLLYPEVEPCVTELNHTLMLYGQDLFIANHDKH